MILSENFAKLAQHTELQLAVFLALHKHTKMLRLFFLLSKAVDWWLREFLLVILA